MKGLLRSRSKAEPMAAIIRQDHQIKDLVVSNIDGATGIGWGTAVLGGLPIGNIVFLGAVLNARVTEASASISNTFSGDFSVGTVPTTDADLSGNKANVIPSTAMGPATSSVATIRGTHTAAQSGQVFDNRDGTLELNLNVLVDDADISADDQSLTANGQLHVIYSVLGDNLTFIEAPEMVQYVAAEVDTGDRWLAGEVIYRKILSFANGANNSTVNVAHGITGLGTVLDVRGFMDNGTLQRNINNVEATDTEQQHYAVDDTNVILVSGTGGDYSGYAGFIVLEYTKA